jgi:ribosomal protein S18 acetylase RimI-like enzyme
MRFTDARLRSATFSDVAALHALLQRAYRSAEAAQSWSHQGELAPGERITRAVLKSLVDDANSHLSVAERGGELVGSSLVQASVEGCEVSLLSVEPAAQSCGLGGALLKHAEEIARRMDCKALSLHVLEHNARLISYYERRDYRQTGASRPYPHQLSRPARLLLLRKALA